MTDLDWMWPSWTVCERISALKLLERTRGGGLTEGRWWNDVLFSDEQHPCRNTSAAAESAIEVNQ